MRRMGQGKHRGYENDMTLMPHICELHCSRRDDITAVVIRLTGLHPVLKTSWWTNRTTR
jgi:hypothetical protein